MKIPFDFIKRMMICGLALALVSCAYAPWKERIVAGATPDEKLVNARAAQKQEPEKLPPRADLRVTQEQTINDLMTQVDNALRDGRKQDAEALYGRVLVLDPNNPRAIVGQQILRREQQHVDQIKQAQALFTKGNMEAAQAMLRLVLLENPNDNTALELQQKIHLKQAVNIRSAPPELKPPFNKPVTLEFRDANIKMVFEALSKTTGINFILDKDIKPDAKATVFIKKARIEDAIEMVLATNGLQKKALSETSALVFPNTAQKLKDYQDLMIRSFYLTNSSAKQVATLLKTMLKTKDVYVDDRLNMLVVRDTPEVIRIAEKLVAANDMADPEVMLEMEVLEVSRSRLQELGIQYPNQLAVATPTGAAALTLDTLRNLTSKVISVSPNPALNFNKTTGDVNLLANPRIRVRNNEKAKIHIGDKVPVITTTSTANVGVSESVQYLDVGLKLEVEPRITLDDNVNIKISLEVASIAKTIATKNGGLVYQVGTRNTSTLLRLKNGETQILAGLISDEERENANKLPGLGDIPVLGRLFASEKDEKNKTEIILAITPRIINNIQRSEADIQEYWSGTDAVVTDKPQMVAPVSGGGRSLPAPATVEPEQPMVEAPKEAVEAEKAVTPADAPPPPPANP
ncbi:MAG: secretin N-terminal domain-containing protein [Methylophilaceae bacterium]